MNSLLPLGAPAANAINNLKTNVVKLNNQVASLMNNTQKNLGRMATAAGDAVGVSSGWMMALGIFVGLLIIFLVLMSFFSTQIKSGYENLLNSIRGFMGLPTAPPTLVQETGGEAVTRPSVPPQDVSPSEAKAAESIVEKVLPVSGNPEVFNVSKNTFTYYDAEPLCRALGAELATYDQVKAAWEKGADWCNYGWVKGQTAVYPTQQGTWDRLQAGPEEERISCGRPGLNGGYFDNPELRFGVNCYGSKPSQSQHDEAVIAKRTGVPTSPAGIAMEKKVAEYRSEASHLGIMPFNQDKWSTS